MKNYLLGLSLVLGLFCSAGARAEYDVLVQLPIQCALIDGNKYFAGGYFKLVRDDFTGQWKKSVEVVTSYPSDESSVPGRLLNRQYLSEVTGEANDGTYLVINSGLDYGAGQKDTVIARVQESSGFVGLNLHVERAQYQKDIYLSSNAADCL